MYERTLDYVHVYYIIVDLVDRFTVFFCFPFKYNISPIIGGRLIIRAWLGYYSIIYPIFLLL